MILFGGCASTGDKGSTMESKSAVVQIDSVYYVNHDGVRRRYVVHTPNRWLGIHPLPVVLAFHGGGASAELQRIQSRMNATSDARRFIVVYPDGSGKVNALTWNAGTCCGDAARNDSDDVGFVRKLIDDLALRVRIDRRRVYATGMSNGGMFAHRLAVECSDIFAAASSVAGTLMLERPEPPSRPVPFMHFHGMLDPSAPYDGGLGRIEKVMFRSVPDTIAWWVSANRCDPVPRRVTGDEYFVDTYSPKEDAAGAPVVSVVLPRGGHTWPGGVDVTKPLGTGDLIESVSANDMMWAFFVQHSLP